jgi:hypothetical protein
MSTSGKTAQITQNSEIIREKRLRNLKPFKPGQSGNPGGRPKRLPITEIYERILNDPRNCQRIETAILKLLLSGQMSSVLMLKQMADRMEGKVTDQMDLNVDATTKYADAVARIRKRLASSESPDARSLRQEASEK